MPDKGAAGPLLPLRPFTQEGQNTRDPERNITKTTKQRV